jgi:hypothetical protein
MFILSPIADVRGRRATGFQVRIELPGRFVGCHRDCIRYFSFGFPDFMVDVRPKTVSTGSLRLQIGKEIVNVFLPSAHGLILPCSSPGSITTIHCDPPGARLPMWIIAKAPCSRRRDQSLLRSAILKRSRHRRGFSTPLMAIEPIVDHRMSQRFRLLAVASYVFPGAFNITGMNGYAPVVALDPGADSVPDASVFHQDILRSN